MMPSRDPAGGGYDCLIIIDASRYQQIERVVLMSNSTAFTVIGADPEPDRFRMCRRLLVGPWCNQPEEYEGYNGFVGWAGVTRLRNGRWVVTFSSGYWHASFPQTPEVLADEEGRGIFEEYHTQMNCPQIYAPRGGRAHVMTSHDQGLTWSRPGTLVDTDMDDRSPTILELDDGTLLCTFFQYRLPRVFLARYMLSHDGGATWTEPVAPHPRAGSFSNGCAIQLSDGTVAWVIDGKYGEHSQHTEVGIFLSRDHARTFQLAAVLSADHNLCEAGITELPDGRLIVVTRRDGDIFWSYDGGYHWTPSPVLGMEIYDPHFLVLPNGVLACFHGAYQAPVGGIHVALSPDGGATWHGPGERYGYSVDPSVYGYCHPMLLPDGTVYLVYLHTGGHVGADPRTEALWGLRLRVRDAADGIDILPAPGSPADLGLPPEALCLLDPRSSGGDPELGEL